MARGKVRASRIMIDAMRGRVTGKVCSMVCGYDKVKVGQIAVAVLAAHVLRKLRPRCSI